MVCGAPVAFRSFHADALKPVEMCPVCVSPRNAPMQSYAESEFMQWWVGCKPLRK